MDANLGDSAAKFAKIRKRILPIKSCSPRVSSWLTTQLVLGMCPSAPPLSQH